MIEPPAPSSLPAPSSPVLSDSPVGGSLDRLEFDRYVDPLVEVLTNDATETPFTIGVFGAWGSGKSSLIKMIDQRLAADHGEAFVRVHFNPWIHRKEPTMLLPLLHTVQDTLAEDGRGRFAAAVKRIGSLITTLSMDVLLRKATEGAVTIDRVEQLSERYAERRGQVESEIRKLRSTLQRQADAIAAKGARLVIFVDDLDRCEPAEIVDVLESLKLFLDLRNVFIVVAIAKEIVDRGVAARYREFGFSAEQVVEIGDEYLDKIIQLPVYLLPLDAVAVGRFLDALDLPAPIAAQTELLRRVVTPNPRRIKRVLNICAVTHAISRRHDRLEDLRFDVLVRLVVLRVQSPALHAAATKRPDLLVALEAAYEGSLNIERTEGFVNRFGAQDAQSMQAAVRRFHDSQDHLRNLFEGAGFAEVAGDLRLYLTMLGG
ncbi:KAP family P-loop NTPase fold protein [Sphaerisporangium dianthi]|uniref:P-loop NTPase fold protein n=1 Tax=Sphaerisporangium dianthi TaxID=1436120 RepID=A0ABV9CB79_9ACTN